MNKFLTISILTFFFSASSHAQVGNPQDQKIRKDKQEMPIMQMQGGDSLRNRQDLESREVGMPSSDPQGKSNEGGVPQFNGKPNIGKGGPDMRNVRMINLKLNKNAKIAARLKDRQRELKDKFGDETRGISQYLVSGYANAGLNIVSSIVDKAIESGVDALIKKIKGHHDEWSQMNQKENIRKDSIIMSSQVNDFYSNFSLKGALDPDGLQFDGVTLERKDNGKTTFRLVTHLDTSPEGLDKILGHSKFSLIVDTLYFDIKNCGLPNRESAGMSGNDNTCFSFANRKSLSEKITITITSSYISPAIEVYKDIKLGTFDINLQGIEAKDTINGYIYEYYRGKTAMKDKEPIISGECFIVPRSYNGMRDPETNEFKELYGLGEYKVNAILITTCTNTPEFEKNWKDDWRAYKERQKELKKGKGKQNGESVNWFTQYFDQNYKSWITTVAKVPASASKSYVQKLIQQQTNEGGNGMGGQNGGMGNSTQGGMMDANGMQNGNQHGMTNNSQGSPQGGQGGPQGNGNPPVM